MPVRVRLLGHLASLVKTPEIELSSVRTVGEVLQEVVKRRGENIVRGSLLVAVNGVEVSALNGESTILRDGDLVELIPIIHGGKQKSSLGVNRETSGQ